jgi:hypothetical protein
MDTMTPSKTEPLSEGQIAKVTSLVAAKLRKSSLPLKQSQEVLEQQGAEMANNFYADFRKRVEARSDMIVRRARVNRNRTPREAVAATGRNKYVNDTVVDSMPVGEGEEIDVYFFKPKADEYTRPGWMSDDDLAKAFERRDLEPDPRALLAVNEEFPEFADEHPNGTHWKDGDDKWCFATCDRWGSGRGVDVGRSGGDDWSDGWLFGGVRK